MLRPAAAQLGGGRSLLYRTANGHGHAAAGCGDARGDGHSDACGHRHTCGGTATTPPGVRIVPDQYPTIAAALDGVAANGYVVLRGGVYREQAVVRTAGVTLMASPGETVWLDEECVRTPAVQVLANDVKIKGLGIKRADAGIIVNGESRTVLPARTLVDGNTIQDYNCTDSNETNVAIGAWYTGAGLVVTNNKITRRVELPGDAAGYGTGIWFKSNSSTPSGGGHRISGNTIIGGWDGIGGEEENSPRGSFDRDTVIEKNTIRNCWDDGIQVEGGGQNVVIQDNDIRECGTGIALATPLTGPTTSQRNHIVSSTVGLQGNLMCFKVGNDSLSTVVIKDNVCETSGAVGSSGIQQTNSGTAVYQVAGNTWRVNGYMFQIYGTQRPGSSYDGDCFEARDPTRFVKWVGSVQVTSLAAFQQLGYEHTGRMGPC
jgi:hypothetical protein